jgi:thiol-disulfide isomerase/thioredoxin
MRRAGRGIYALAALLLISAGAAAEEAPFKIGDMAPPLNVERWLQGRPVKHFERGHVYALDFWTPWCPPCVSELPYLSELQERYAARGVRIVALTGPDTAGTNLEGVTAFLAKKQGITRLTVAYDRKDTSHAALLDILQGTTAIDYLGRAHAEGIPVALVVDQEGRLAWIGHASQLAPVLESVVARTWDRTAAARRWQAVRDADTKVEEYQGLLKQGHTREAMAIARELVDGEVADDSANLRLIASDIAAAAKRGARPPELDLDLALTAITRAETLSAGADITVFGVLARVRFLRGDRDGAIEAQKRAIALAEPAMREHLTKVLVEEYQADVSTSR